MAKWLTFLATKPEDLDRFRGVQLILVFFPFCFNILMVNCFIYYENGIIKTTEMVIPELFFIELCMKHIGAELNLALLKEN